MMKTPVKWVAAISIISILMPLSFLSLDGQEGLVRFAGVLSAEVGYERGAVPAEQEQAAEDVLQHLAYAHLVINGVTADIHAGFTHPYDPVGQVRIEWTLFAWNEGWATHDQLGTTTYTSSTGSIEIDSSRTVPDNYDYYLLECKDKIWENGIWTLQDTSESRFSRIAPFNGIWERTGEVTSASAVLHTYLTEKPPFDATEGDTLRVPPMAGFAQFSVFSDPGLADLVAESGYFPVDDYIQTLNGWRRVNYNFRWTVSGLEPNTTYFYLLGTKSSDGLDERMASNINSFKTSPYKDSDQAISFVVAHCLDVTNTAYEDPLEAAERGLKVFDSMLTFDERQPDFVIMQGDTIYYDGGDYSPDVGPYLYNSFIRRWLYWYATYQFTNMMFFYQHIPGYWMVDDHDYWQNNINQPVPDGWYIFRNTNPTPGEYGTAGEAALDYYNDNSAGTSQGDGSKYWRSVRWGKHLELFIEEGRNHRDGDASLIWGDDQRQWLEQNILASQATFKIISASTTLLGPVLPDASLPTVIPDKHANDKFRAETELFLTNIRSVDNVFILAGDRHYKYHTVVNSLNYPALSHFSEFGSGSAAAPPHAIPGGVPDSDFATRLWSDADGPGASAGYLRVDIVPGVAGVDIIFRLIRVTQDVDNDVVYQYVFSSTAPTPTPETPTPTPTSPVPTPVSTISPPNNVFIPFVKVNGVGR